MAKTKVLDSFASLGSSEIAARVIAFVGTAYLARVLGTSNFGILGFAIALCGYLALAVRAGTNEIGAREVARHPKQAVALGGSVILVRLILAAAAFVLIVVVAKLLNKPPTVKLVVILTALSFFTLAIDLSWVLKGLERNRYVGLAIILSQALYVGLVLLTVNEPSDILRVPLAQFAGELVAAIVLATVVFRLGRARFRLRTGWEVLRSSGPLALSKALRTIIFSFDILMIAFLIGESQVGIYTAAYRLCFFLLAISTALGVAYLPALTRAAHSENLPRIASQALALAAWFGAPLIIGGIVLAEPILIAVFGAEYAPGAEALRYLLLSIGFMFLNEAIHGLFLVRDWTKTEMWFVAGGAILNVLLNLLLIPDYGIVGAAVATAVTEGLIFLVGVTTLWRKGITLDFRPAMFYIFIGCAMGIAVYLLDFRGMSEFIVLKGILAGSVVYTGLMVAFRSFPDEIRPYMDHAVRTGSAAKKRLKRVWHHIVGPTTEQVRQAQKTLGSREYYQLYDDVYRAMAGAGLRSVDFMKIARTRNLIHDDFKQLRNDGCLPEPNSTLVDLGSGDGQNALYFAKLGFRVTGVDLSPTAIQMAREMARQQGQKIDFQIDDVTRLDTLPDHSFDLVSDVGCLHMLVHREHRQQYFRQVRRILRPDGRYLLFAHMSPRDVHIADEQRHVLESITLVEERGFSVDGHSVKVRGCGYRTASLGQYKEELSAEGFEVVREHDRWSSEAPFGMLLARLAR